VELGIEWKNVMAFRVHSDRVVIIEGPGGYKRTYMLTGEEEVEGEEASVGGAVRGEDLARRPLAQFLFTARW
jgi:hypothetical protein